MAVESIQCDVLIVGGGLVGASLACALESTGRSSVLVEESAGAGAQPPSFDERNLALAEASLNALGALGVLRQLRTPPAPIERIHISRQGDFGAVRLDARAFGRAAFGGVVIARELGAALEARLRELRALRRCRPARVLDFQTEADRIVAEAIGPEGRPLLRIAANLLVAADGSDSRLRQRAGIAATRQDYQQTLFVCALASDRPPQGQAWERFSDSGPVALLPRPDRSYGSVCGVPAEQVDRINDLDDRGYLDYLQQRFGGRAGRFLRVGSRTRYPLTSVLAERLVGERLVLVGNAAQSLHPIGAQGFNLGLRDALSLAELLNEPGDAGAAELLVRYPGLREADRTATLAFSDGLARFTAAPGLPAHLLRSLGLIALDSLPDLRAGLVAGAMGYRGRVPALARA